MGLHIEIRSFNLLQNIFPGLHPHIVDIDVHDREHGLQDLRKREVVKGNHGEDRKSGSYKYSG